MNDIFDMLDGTQESLGVGGDRADAGVKFTAKPACRFWDDRIRRCRRKAYPNWFCQSVSSNRDGKLTAEGRAITQAYCSAFTIIGRLG